MALVPAVGEVADKPRFKVLPANPFANITANAFHGNRGGYMAYRFASYENKKIATSEQEREDGYTTFATPEEMRDYLEESLRTQSDAFLKHEVEDFFDWMDGDDADGAGTE